MKVIPKKQFIKIIKLISNELVSEDDVVKLFENYGDEYHFNKTLNCFERVVDNSEKRFSLMS